MPAEATPLSLVASVMGVAAKRRNGPVISESVAKVLADKVERHNAQVSPSSLTSLETAKMVYRRGADSYERFHSEAASRNQWAMRRVDLYLASLADIDGRSALYAYDLDLLPAWHPKSQRHSWSADWDLSRLTLRSSAGAVENALRAQPTASRFLLQVHPDEWEEALERLLPGSLTADGTPGVADTPNDIAAVNRLKRYWLFGKGAAKIRWNTKGDFTRCYRHLRKYMGTRAKGYCANLHKIATGLYTGDKKHRMLYGWGGKSAAYWRQYYAKRVMASGVVLPLASSPVTRGDSAPTDTRRGDLVGVFSPAFGLPVTAPPAFLIPGDEFVAMGEEGSRWLVRVMHRDAVPVTASAQVTRFVTCTDCGGGSVAVVASASKDPYWRAFHPLLHGTETAMLIDDVATERVGRFIDPAFRRDLAQRGYALPDGSYPVETREDLQRCLRTIAVAPDKEVVRNHLIRRAVALGATDLMPAAWPAEPTVASAEEFILPVADMRPEDDRYWDAASADEIAEAFGYVDSGNAKSDFYSPARRRELAREGLALADGSFPIDDEIDLRRAVRAWSRARDKGAARRHIIMRARQLGLLSLIPAPWWRGTTAAVLQLEHLKAELGLSDVDLLDYVDINDALAEKTAEELIGLDEADLGLEDIEPYDDEDQPGSYTRRDVLIKSATREKFAKKGWALPDGSFPIKDERDLRRAIKAIGRAKDPAKARKHIIKRAKQLKKESLVPPTWTGKRASAYDASMRDLVDRGGLMEYGTDELETWLTQNEDALLAGGLKVINIPDDLPRGPQFRIPLIIPEGVPSGDGRTFMPGSLGVRDLPLPLMWQPQGQQGHDGAVIVGRIDTVERTETGLGNATGYFDISPMALEAARMVKQGMLRGVSADLDDFEARILDKKTGDNDDTKDTRIGPDEMEISKARLMAVTLVAKPAFQGTTIELINSDEAESDLDEEHVEDPSADMPGDQLVPSDVPQGEIGPQRKQPEVKVIKLSVIEDGEYIGATDKEYQVAALIASAVPVKPPAEWFEDPRLSEPTPLQITENGQVFGHIAAWDVSHIGMPFSTRPPRSASGYRYFTTGTLETAEGHFVNVGQLTLAGGHASLDSSAAEAVRHYDDTASAYADVAAGEDRFGIWVAGALRPHVTPEQVRVARASAPSGDWRPINGRLELVAVCQVNVPGFPVVRARVASGSMLALVAAGAAEIAKLRPASDEVLARLEAIEARVQASDPEVIALREKANEAKMRVAAVREAKIREQRDEVLARVAGVREFRDYGKQTREEYAKKGEAMKDGSYPIHTVADLENAIHAYGRAPESKRAAVRRHIMKRARALKHPELIPDDWTKAASREQLTAAGQKVVVEIDVKAVESAGDGAEVATEEPRSNDVDDARKGPFLTADEAKVKSVPPGEEPSLPDSSDVEDRAWASWRAHDQHAIDGEALPDGSFLIRDEAELRAALRTYKYTKDEAVVRNHIINRAQALGFEDLLPDEWREAPAVAADETVTVDPGGRTEGRHVSPDLVEEVEVVEEEAELALRAEEVKARVAALRYRPSGPKARSGATRR